MARAALRCRFGFAPGPDGGQRWTALDSRPAHIRHFGMSEASARTVRRAHAVQPLAAAEVDLTLDDPRELEEASARSPIQGARYPESATRMVGR